MGLDGQQETIDPLTMPLTRLANSVIDAVVDRVEAVIDDVAKYFGSDLLFYRAGHPEALVAREAAHWDPIVFWAADALGAHFILAEGIVHVRQPDSAIAAARAALPTNAWSIAALHVVTTLTGSALLALALMRGVIDQDQAWAAAHVDEDWNIEQWGRDEEVGRAPRGRGASISGLPQPFSNLPLDRDPATDAAVGSAECSGAGISRQSSGCGRVRPLTAPTERNAPSGST